MELKRFIYIIYMKIGWFLAKFKLDEIPFLRKINKSVVRLLRPKLMKIQGHTMFLDREDSLHLSYNKIFEPIFEPNETNLVKKVIKRGDVVVDIGANIGYYSLIFLKIIGEEGRVFSFEPDPYCFNLLKKNIEINHYNNAMLIQKAISNENGRAKLYISDSYNANQTIHDLHDDRRSIEIETIRLDDYFRDYNKRIDFIKIDTEGSEAKILQGMPLLLQKNKDIKIMAEFWPLGLKKSGADPAKYLELVLGYGFKIYDINEEGMDLSNAESLLKKYTAEKGNYTNLLFKR